MYHHLGKLIEVIFMWVNKKNECICIKEPDLFVESGLRGSNQVFMDRGVQKKNRKDLKKRMKQIFLWWIYDATFTICKNRKKRKLTLVFYSCNCTIWWKLFFSSNRGKTLDEENKIQEIVILPGNWKKGDVPSFHRPCGKNYAS